MLHGDSKQRLMGKVLLVSTKVGASLFALCSTSVFMLSLSLTTDSHFESVNTNQKFSQGPNKELLADSCQDCQRKKTNVHVNPAKNSQETLISVWI